MSLTLTNNIVDYIKRWVNRYIEDDDRDTIRPADITADFLSDWFQYDWMGGALGYDEDLDLDGGEYLEEPTQEQRDLLLKMFKVFVEEMGAYQDINTRREYIQAYNTDIEDPCGKEYGNNVKANDDITQYIPLVNNQ